MARDARAGAALRIIGGALGGRRFGRPEPVTRPTSDRVREAVASILASRLPLEGAQVLELFAGTGAYAFELLSRGAAHAVLLERDPRAARDIEASAESLGLSTQIQLVRADVRAGPRALGQGLFDVVIADPPYDAVSAAVEAIAELGASGRVRPGGLIVLEHRTSDAAGIDPSLARSVASSQLRLLSRYRYGDTTITLLENGGAPTPRQNASSEESDER